MEKSNFLLFSDFEWDFDTMLRQKKDERQSANKRRRNRGGVMDLLSDADDLIKEFIANMKHAAAVC